MIIHKLIINRSHIKIIITENLIPVLLILILSNKPNSLLKYVESKKKYI